MNGSNNSGLMAIGLLLKFFKTTLTDVSKQMLPHCLASCPVRILSPFPPFSSQVPKIIQIEDST